jgi:murein L,D-transpeptidase YafK
MRFIARVVLVVAVALGLAACGSKFRTYHGPEVTRIEVWKADRRMTLFHHDESLRTFRIALGFAPVGHKLQEGDGRTPEGWYTIDRRNPNSRFHLSLGISYPNAQDIALARSLGVSPGGDIFIHGRAGQHRGRPRDWTAGCIAVRDHEMEEIFAMVRIGTPILIRP